MKSHHVFCVSDHTGVTVEAVAKSVLAQFPDLEFSLITLPFIDTAEKVRSTVARIESAPGALVFSSLTRPELRDLLRQAGVALFDIFDLLAPAVESALGRPAVPSGGRTHGMANNYESRIDAVNFSLALDDGLQPQRLDQADLILVGVSRVGKTPTALYLALQYGLRGPMTIAALLFAFGCAVSAVAPEMWVVLVGRLFQGDLSPAPAEPVHQ